MRLRSSCPPRMSRRPPSKRPKPRARTRRKRKRRRRRRRRRQRLRRSSPSVRAFDDLTNDRLHLVAAGFLVFTRHMFHEALRFVIRHEVDRRAAEATAGEPRAEAPAMFARQLDEQIQLFRAVLQRIPRALVALEHVLAELPVIVLA